MSEEKKIDMNSIIKDDSDKKKMKSKIHFEITFRQYLEEFLQKDSKIAQNAHARLLEIIKYAGIEEIPEEKRWMGADIHYSLFDELYGVDRSIAQYVDHVEAGANNASSGKLLALIVGPPGTGKSTAVRILVNALEHYNRRPVFVIKGCPKFEEPLHLLPRNLQKEMEEKLNVRVEGDLCSVCRHLLMTKYQDADGTIRWWDVPVETFTFSKQARRGVTSFEAEGEKSSDVSALTGRENISITSVHGYDHPRAYEIGGEIPRAERGLCEGRELLSSDPDVLKIFFSVAEEKELKISGSSFPHLSVDTNVIGHTNLAVYKKFATNKEYEGLHQRFYLIFFPYPLRVKDEVKTYKKLIERNSDFIKLKECHMAPGTLELAATFAVMSRLIQSSKSKGIGLLTKAKLYNGEMVLSEIEIGDETLDVRGLIDEGQTSSDVAKREGMFGATPRDVLAALNTVLVQESRKAAGKKCLTPLSAISALRNVFEHRMGYSPEDLERFKVLLFAGEGESVMTEYRRYAVETVNRAFLKTYKDLAQELFTRYIDEAVRYRAMKRKFVKGGQLELERDNITGKLKEPDEKFLRSIEQHIPWTESEAEIGRGEILEHKANNPDFSFESYRPLARAVEKKLLSDSREMLTAVLAIDKPKGSEEKKRTDDLFDSLKKKGFCEICARETVEKVREFLRE